MCELMLNLLRSICNFCTKRFESINNYVHNGKERPHQVFGDGYIIAKTLLCLRSAGDWTYIHIRITQHIRFTIHFCTYLFWKISFKIYNAAWVVPSFGERLTIFQGDCKTMSSRKQPKNHTYVIRTTHHPPSISPPSPPPS